MPKTMTKTAQDSAKASKLTQKRLNSHKVLLYIGFALIAFTDICTFVLLMLSGVSFGYYAFPLVLVILDAVMLAAIVFSNFRFRYSIALPVV